MTIKEAHTLMEDLQRVFTQYRFIFSNEIAEANGLAILALEKQMEQNHLSDKVGEKTDDTDKLKFVAHKLEQLDEKIQQLEKDVHRLEMNPCIIEKRTYPNITSTGISAYAGPEFNGVCYGLPTNAP